MAYITATPHRISFSCRPRTPIPFSLDHLTQLPPFTFVNPMRDFEEVTCPSFFYLDVSRGGLALAVGPLPDGPLAPETSIRCSLFMCRANNHITELACTILSSEMQTFIRETASCLSTEEFFLRCAVRSHATPCTLRLEPPTLQWLIYPTVPLDYARRLAHWALASSSPPLWNPTP